MGESACGAHTKERTSADRHLVSGACLCLCPATATATTCSSTCAWVSARAVSPPALLDLCPRFCLNRYMEEGQGLGDARAHEERRDEGRFQGGKHKLAKASSTSTKPYDAADMEAERRRTRDASRRHRQRKKQRLADMEDAVVRLKQRRQQLEQQIHGNKQTIRILSAALAAHQTTCPGKIRLKCLSPDSAAITAPIRSPAPSAVSSSASTSTKTSSSSQLQPASFPIIVVLQKQEHGCMQN